jgi:hypothetical protein
MTDREGHAVTLLKAYHLRAGLHAGTLFGQHELAAPEVLAGF